MILFISAKQSSLESPIDERFGRAPWLVKLDTATNQWEAYSNPGANQSSGAGVAAAQFVIDLKGDAIISGDYGPHAASAFRIAKIEMRLFSNDVSTVQKAIDYFLQGKLAAFA